MRNQPAIRDLEVARIAARQHGVVTFRQLGGAGLAKSAVHRRSKSGRLHRIHRGVYAVGHRGLSREGRWMAAVLALGDRAVLSHRSAASLWRLLSASGAIDVSVPGDGGRERRNGIRLHRSLSLTGNQTTRREGIPVTTPARTIADLRRFAGAEQVRQAARQAGVIGLDIGEHSETDLTRSELERQFLILCRRHHLTTPEVNAGVGSYTVDFLWREKRLIVEMDGYRYHRGRHAFEADRARDMKLRLLGYEVLRVTYKQVSSGAADLAHALRNVLVKPGHSELAG